MATLNPDLLDATTHTALNRAADLMRQYGKPLLMPEIALLALLRMPESTAYRALARLAESRGFGLKDLESEVDAQIKSRSGRNANFIFYDGHGEWLRQYIATDKTVFPWQ